MLQIQGRHEVAIAVPTLVRARPSHGESHTVNVSYNVHLEALRSPGHTCPPAWLVLVTIFQIAFVLSD
jgi:hypothetical protein